MPFSKFESQFKSVFGDIDFAKVEERLLANAASGVHVDEHTETAKQVFQTDKPTDAMRRQAKTINMFALYHAKPFGGESK